ncbi:KpsF/GutQ family sugar-phosphate isomerase [Colwellia sp. 4_MG-2023]|jgi:arabinose-5-phosphate isomerase|uniref:KpsF/GutQ family sugar-phosphate isomerase n=1 Tax=unclassified Colwellia TaxID=196834 RepID=UPI001C09744F|nr:MULTISPECIES: KpsF/GutQ family sugar-phosphate isomerase [unclassified Colwellia]MBU2925017.1 KpsF/GutQ family sugar-phosphate isomerase [Colwellia sp. C2M11]MDO6486422.1 KpsF/GutQ family sugar-phosphate isomerase [Colwellia sp. 6_MG-2023]MDO6506300.1 KpsF/GutQ family sugar-phosphate isomerase [Colwellia sp. 5_MG-2023]MDO6555124.1 KpsF/GutQ family sugar-phosphate isomerase [Colwellia sp. 4_MG-2023]MDO6651690.1 KpsF/GutQ family sugar-phosphate isomerase [Colwellia sp. 3_MG-2023]
MKNFKKLAKNVINIEQQAIKELLQYIDHNFEYACQLMFNCQGRVIVIGMGKSGHIGGKIAATLASTGTPAFFVHPSEASHGDLGMITKDDVVLTISNSGETGEVLAITPVIKRIGATLIAMTGNINSTLAKLADTHICIKVSAEACPLGLAPTSSTTATLVMGDAIAVALLNARGFTADDFALSHPGGSLGKRLLLRLSDIMHQGDRIPIISEDALIKDALVEMSLKGLGMTAVVNKHKQLVGLFTDGDLRRILDLQIDIHRDNITTVMTKFPTLAQADMLAAQALNIMEDKKINGLIIVDEKQIPIGAMNMHDLLRSGVL